MKRLLPVVVLFCLVAPAGAAKKVVVTSLPEPVRAFAETETNVAFAVGTVTNSAWKLSVELDASASKCVEVVHGTDADGDGALGVSEGDLSVGWDCGAWFWRDRRANRTCRAEGAGSRLDLTLHLRRGRVTQRSSSAAFPTTELPTCFDPDWNLARVVSRGASAVRVTSKISPSALLLSIK